MPHFLGLSWCVGGTLAFMNDGRQSTTKTRTLPMGSSSCLGGTLAFLNDGRQSTTKTRTRPMGSSSYLGGAKEDRTPDLLHAMSRYFLNSSVEIGIPTTLINQQKMSGQALSPDTPLRVGRDPDRVFKRVSGPAAPVFLKFFKMKQGLYLFPLKY